MLSADEIQSAFDASLPSYIEYMQSAAGRLRHVVILHHLRAALPPRSRILDVGAGLGELSTDLARDGHAVTLLDFSRAMLDQARQNCAGLDVVFVRADVNAVGTPFSENCFDVILCHSLFEFMSEPQALLSQLACQLRDPGLLSIVFGNRYHAPLQEILLRHDARRARVGLDEELPGIDRFGLTRHTFYPETIRAMIESIGLRVIGEYGIRVFADLLNGTVCDWSELLELELSASARMPYRQMARFVQFIAEKP
jgi:S-adenosylmethionine-dependent methyltransferase